MNWIVGTKLSTAKGEATVIEMTDKVATIQFLDGTTKEIAYVSTKEASALGTNKVGRMAHVRTPKTPKEPKAPKAPKIKQEKEDRKAEKALAKLNAELAEAMANKARLDALKA